MGTMEHFSRIVCDSVGNNVVLIDAVYYMGRKPNWNDVEDKLKEYVGACYEVEQFGDKVNIGTEFPDEYAHSCDTKSLRGGNIKAKANAIFCIPEMIKIATNKTYSENNKEKHKKDAQNGWYRYDTRFALPVYNDNEKVLHYNVFQARMLVRCGLDEKMYLYDFINIKKGTCKPLEL